YMLAAIHQAADRPDAAVAVLSECEGIYERLGQAKFLDARPLIADVKIRRAGALADQGLGASAVVEAATAVTTYMQITGSADGEKQMLDLARVLARNSLILARFGDPDMAVASADRAVRTYLTHPVNPEHAGYFCQALAQAALIHLDQGRLDLG